MATKIISYYNTGRKQESKLNCTITGATMHNLTGGGGGGGGGEKMEVRSVYLEEVLKVGRMAHGSQDGC